VNIQISAESMTTPAHLLCCPQKSDESNMACLNSEHSGMTVLCIHVPVAYKGIASPTYGGTIEEFLGLFRALKGH
jgi:hypothetical protein